MKKISQQSRAKLILLLAFFIILSVSQQQFIEPQAVQNIEKPTLIESNHYYSSKQRSVNYNVVSLNKNLPVMIIPKNQDKQKITFSNRVNITLNDNQGNYISCLFEDNYELCVLEKFNADTLSMIIQCDSIPCEFSWLMLQSPIQKINTTSVEKNSLKQLYEVQQSHQNRHLTLKVTCDSPELESNFHHQLQFYANRENYHRLKTQGITYYLFTNPPTSFKEYFYIKINEKYRTCAKIEIYNQQTNASINAVINDFVLGSSSVVYNLPSSFRDLQVDTNIHFFSQTQDFTGSFSVKLMGSIGGIQQVVRKMSLQTKKKKIIAFSFVLNNITENYSNLRLMFQSSNLDCIFKFQLLSGEIQKVQKGEFSFFSLKKGQKVKYQIVENPSAQNNDKAYVFPSDENKIKLSQRECSSKTGCQFSVEAMDQFDGSIYIGESKVQNKQEVVKFAIDKSFTKRVREDSIVYLKKPLQQKKNYQVVVNTHNVLLYAANEEKCPQPGQKCHQKVGNSHNPFIYESSKTGNLIIAVHALDSSEFTVTIIEQNGQYPELKDAVPFTYLMDDGQEEVVFKFNLDQKEDQTFSLIAPLNELTLYVFQSDKLPKNYVDKTELYTSQGYINLKKSKITSKSFIVVVRKLDPGKAQFVHFTLIASTKNTNIKLEAGVTHLQKLVPNQHQDFVIEFDPSRKYVISFYVHDAVGQKISLSLELSKNDTYTKDKEHTYQIDQEVDEIDISEEGQRVCEKKGTSSCEVFLRVKNQMSKNANLQLTLLTTNSIVELNDGLWQYFPEELTSTTTHFYFFPKHHSNPISILYQSNNPDLRILYSLTKMDVNTINPELWSFPSITNQQNSKQYRNLDLKQVKQISIGKQALSLCTPNCLVLMTLTQSNKVKGQFNEVPRNKQFGIMISNSIIDIPQKTRIDVTLQQNETKYMKMSMKNVFEHDTLTSYIYTSLGFVSVYANACSQKNIRMPTKQEFDFSFGILQTQLRTETIQKKFEANDIDEDENPFLCLIAISDQSSKFSIEYTSEEQIVSLLRLDQFKTVTLEKDETKYFQVEASVQHTVKIVRNKGFPFIQQKKCTGKDMTYQQCLEEFQDDKQKNTKTQMVQKIKRYRYEPCQKCIVYIKLSSEESAQVDLHLESKYTEITLQEKKIFTDYLEKDEQNRYEVTSLSNQATFITVNVINGDIKCKVTDLNGINLEKQSNRDQKVLHFSITSNQLAQIKSKLSSKESNDPFSSLFSGFGLEMLFTTLHVSIQSTDPQKAASYTIQYSSGERESYLQDGMVNHYKLEGNSPDTSVKFYYENFDQNSHVYIFLGAKSSSQLSKLNINIYQMENEDDEDGKQMINSKIPQIRKKTLKPTVLYQLPTAKFYSIEVVNPTGSQIEFSIGVNHQQVVFVPYDIDYPFPLTNSQNVNFIVDVQNKGYVLLTLKKCDQSTIQISYTLDYEGFQKGEFQYTTTLHNDPKFEEMIKVKQPGPLYINIKRNEPEGISFDTEFKNSIFSLTAKFSPDKMRTSDFTKPGNNGLIAYTILENNKIQVQFTEVTCDTKSEFCGKNFEYYLVASDKMVDVYSQSVCPSTYFADIESAQRHNVLPLRKILQKPDSNHKITFQYQFEKSTSISYIAIKAVFKNKQNQSIEVYYQPIEVATIWGQIQKASMKFGTKFGIAFGVVIAFCLFIICLRRKKRKGYQSIEESE